MKADPKLTKVASTWKHNRPLIACRFDPTGQFVFSGAQDYTVQRWDAAGKMTSLAGHESWVRAFGFSPDGQTLYSGGYDGRWITWPAAAENPAPVRTIEAHQGWIRALAVSPDGQRVATCGNDNHVRLWNAADGKLVYEWPGHESHVYNVAFHPSGEFLVSCDLKGNLKQWDTASGKFARDLTAATLHKYDTTFRADIGGARSLAFSCDGKLLAAGGITEVTNAFAGIGRPVVVVVDWETGKPKVQYTEKEATNGVAWGIAQHADGFWVGLSGGRQVSLLCFWKDEAPHEFFKFKLADVGHDMSLHPDGSRLAIAHADGNLRVYTLV